MVNFLASARRLPPLTSFPLFTKLPVEIRTIIWRLTLKSRVVEIEFTELRGFFTRVATPTALRVCHDSRKAVIAYYPTSFGNVMYNPRIVFNFLLDTLYFDMSFHSQVMHFLASMKEMEVRRIQSLGANSMMIWEWGGEVDVDIFSIMKKLVPKMVSLKEFILVFDAASWPELKAKEGSGPTELFPQWRESLWGCTYCEASYLRDTFFLLDSVSRGIPLETTALETCLGRNSSKSILTEVIANPTSTDSVIAIGALTKTLKSLNVIALRITDSTMLRM